MKNDFHELTNKAAIWIKQAEPDTRFRVISHYDADGITAAAIICKALYREGYDYHTTLMRNPFTKGIETLKKEKNTHLIFTDMGSGQLPMIENISAEILVIDHHQLIQENTKKNIIQINANQCGLNGNYDACGSSVSLEVAKQINKNNLDLAGFAIAGATGDKQYIGGFRGINKNIINEAIKEKIIDKHIGLKLSQRSLSESLYYSVEPYYQGLSGDYETIFELLKKLHIDKNETYNDLDKEKKRKLHSILMLHLIKQGCESSMLDTVIRTRYSTVVTYGEMEQFADLLDSCGKGGYRDIGLALCLGDKNSYEEAKNNEKTFKTTLLESLNLVKFNGVKETPSFRYFYTDHTSLGGIIAGIASNFIFDKEKPLFSIARKKGELHISGRGNQYLVNKGLDLGYAMSTVAELVQGHGGGHNIAAGATFPIESEDQFIRETDKIITKQLHIS
jgi:RecJ-like exonuclease